MWSGSVLFFSTPSLSTSSSSSFFFLLFLIYRFVVQPFNFLLSSEMKSVLSIIYRVIRFNISGGANIFDIKTLI